MDPLEPGFTVAHLQSMLDVSRRDLKAFLMDQGRIAGLGNIYVCEALFHAGLSPTRRADSVGPARGKKLHAAIIRVLRAGIENRGTSFSDYVDADGNKGGNQHALWVYGREGEPCRECGARIKRLVQAGRSTFFCARCQK
jgi:formamidopyrimidine-DNA glycosylase